MSQTANRILKNSAYLYANMAFSMFVSLYSTRLILNALGASDFGIFAIVGGAIGMLGFLSSTLIQTTQRFINYAEGSGNHEHKKKIFTVSILLHMLMALFMIIVLEIAFYFFFNGILNIPTERITSAKYIYQFSVVSSALAIVTTPYSAVINAHENMKFYSKLGVFQTIAKLLTAIVIVKFGGDKLILYGMLVASITFIVLIAQRIYCKIHYNECVFNCKKYLDRSLMKEMTSFAGWGVLGSSSSMVSQYGMGIILNNFGGTILNAAQGVANQISGQLLVFSRTMLMAVNPVIGKKAGTKNDADLIRISLMTSKLSFIILAFFAYTFIVEAPFIMKVWLKTVPEWAILFFRFEVCRALLDQLTLPIDTAIRSEGRIKYYNIIRSVSFFMPLPLTFILLYMGFEPYWYYIAWIFCWNIIGGNIILFFAHKNCNMQYKDFFTTLFCPNLIIALFCIIIGFLSSYIMPEGFARLILSGMVIEMTFLTLTWFWGLNHNEKDIIKTVSKSILNRIRK